MSSASVKQFLCCLNEDIQGLHDVTHAIAADRQEVLSGGSIQLDSRSTSLGVPWRQRFMSLQHHPEHPSPFLYGISLWPLR